MTNMFGPSKEMLLNEILECERERERERAEKRKEIYGQLIIDRKS